MADAEDAQLNATEATEVFMPATKLMCFFHVIYNVKKRIKHLGRALQFKVMQGLMDMHFALSPVEFMEVRARVLKLWDEAAQLQSFSAYFRKQCEPTSAECLIDMTVGSGDEEEADGGGNGDGGEVGDAQAPTGHWLYEEIVDWRYVDGVRQARVRWRDTWEPLSMLDPRDVRRHVNEQRDRRRRTREQASQG
ncbi:hypothetical protein P43SY_010992 [Pythium insidiosum]|uniref:MULE transposase domain-containing protein n=1 Tax=Pythium insidiosum TaxID=114742 RepID=A0AAD5L6E9_PYTIN|nr:hypothetical protein P43SY_010992 [Pythium insidiosum]